MEPADIDWRRVVSRFVVDDAFEYIDAPKWADLAAPPDADDVAWFCRPDCRHPCSAEDFLGMRGPSPKGKLLRSASATVTPFGERKPGSVRDNNTVKRRVGGVATSAASSPRRTPPKAKAVSRFEEDSENRDPNTVTPPPMSKARPFGGPKWGKSSPQPPVVEKEELLTKNVPPQKPQQQRQKQLKSTLSAPNLFAGRDIFGQLSNFYNEIKKMAVGGSGSSACDAGEERSEPKPSTPIRKVAKVQVNVECAKERSSPSVLKEVRASPPTPQRFSPSVQRARRTGATAAAPAAPSTLKRPPKAAPERSILKEGIAETGEAKMPFCSRSSKENCANAAADVEGGAPGSGVFWFFKPCTYLVE